MELRFFNGSFVLHADSTYRVIGRSDDGTYDIEPLDGGERVYTVPDADLAPVIPADLSTGESTHGRIVASGRGDAGRASDSASVTRE